MRSRKILVVAVVLGVLLGLYALAGFLWVPKLVQSEVLATFERDYGRTAELARPTFNPFTFELEARSFSVPDDDGARLLGFDRFYIDFELSSLWRRAWTFREIALEQPYLRVVQRADGSLNLADLAPKESADEPASPEGIPSLRVGTLAVAEGQIDVLDRTRAQPFATSLRPVTFSLEDFISTGAGNAFSFAAGSDRAGRLAVDGSFGVAPLTSKGTLALTGLPATTISEYLGDLLPVTLQAGHVDLQLAYDFSLAGDPFKLVIDLPTVSVRELATVARGYDVAWQIPELDVRDTHVDVAASRVHVGAVEVRNSIAPAWIDENGFNAPGLLAHLNPQASAPAVTEAPEAPSDPGWQIEIPDIAVHNATMALEDRTLRSPATVELLARELRIKNFASPQQGPLAVSADLAFGTGGELSLAGSLLLEPLTLAADVATRALDLRIAQAWLDEDTDLVLKSGTLTSKGHLDLTMDEVTSVRYSGDLSVARLHTQDGTLGEDFINWSSLDVRKLEYASDPERFAIREIIAKDPYLRLILAETGVTNIQSVLDPEGAALLVAEIAAERAEQQAGKKDGREQSKPEEEPPAADAPPEPAEPATPASIGVIRVVNGNINFADYTLKPNFAIAIERLAGAITGMTSDPGARARIEFDGEVDRYAPTRIEGELNLLAAESYMDINASFRNIELTSFNPYSGKFAGYRIDKGKLSIETKYHVEERILTANHQFIINQLQLGDKVESPDAVGLPLKLAVALLKDRNGVIDIDLPVSGTLDDPKFRLGPIIWKAVLNLLVKIVTSPFALLGNLFGGGADLSSVDFAPGSAVLDASATEKVVALKKALDERPSLNLDIPSTFDPPADRKVLEEQKWEQALDHAGIAAGEQPTDADQAWRNDREEYLKRLKLLHRERLGSKPEIPKPPKPAEGALPVDPTEYAIAALEPVLRATAVVEEPELAALGEARAAAVRDVLLGDGTIDPTRVFMIRGEPVTATDGTVRMVLTLK
jgi:uncharacterized protein involved in outer membrane biogenesis